MLYFLGYIFFIIAISVFIGRKVKSTSYFFVANRSLNWTLLCATILAANIGAGSTVLATGLGYQNGLAAWWWVGSAGIGTLILAFWIGPKIWRVAKKNNLLTLGDFLEYKYNRQLKIFISTVITIASLAILAGQLIAFAWVLDVLFSYPKWLSILIGGSIMVFYFAAGGIMSSVWVNLIQLIILFSGFMVALFTSFDYENLSNLELSTFFVSGESGFMYLFMLAPAFIVSPGILQKVFAAKDEQNLKKGLLVCGLMLLLFALIPTILGITAKVILPDLANPEYALPELFLTLPNWVSLLALAGVLSAEISSADAILFMLTTSISKDFYKGIFNPNASDVHLLKVTRVSAIVAGSIGILLAILLPNIATALTIFYSVLTVSLFVPLIFGLFCKNINTTHVLISSGFGVLVLFLAQIFSFELPWWMTNVLLGLLTSVVLFSLLHFVYNKNNYPVGRSI